jgi:hypothetical protein
MDEAYCIILWTIKKIEFLDFDNSCTDNTFLFVSWENWGYILYSRTTLNEATNNLCAWWGSIVNRKDVPNIWDKIESLVGNYYFWWSRKIEQWKYGIWEMIMEWDFEICKPNYHFIIWSFWVEAKYFKYVQTLWIVSWIIILLLIVIILLKKYKFYDTKHQD